MGYRQYLYKVPKTLIEEIQSCKIEEDLYNLYRQHGFEVSKDEYDGETEYYCPLYKLPYEAYGFGKYYENSDELYKISKPLFTSQELQERYEYYRAIIGEEEILLSCIEWQKQHIIKMYENMLNNTFENPYEREIYYKDLTDDEIKLKRLEQHCKDYLRWWDPPYGDFTAINMNKDKDNIVDSWLYEHTIFDLVRIYKEFDSENEVILFLGW